MRQPRKISSEQLAEIFRDYSYARGDGHDETRAAALKAAVEFCQAMCSGTTEAYWLVLCGPSGIGKTLLARLVYRFFNRYLDLLLDEHRNRNENERYTRFGTMKRWPMAMKSAIEDANYGWVGDTGEAWLAVLDDIGSEYAKHRDLSTSLLFQILTQREHKFTVITSNLSVEDVSQKLDTRIGSRLLRHGSVVLDLRLPDWNATR